MTVTGKRRVTIRTPRSGFTLIEVLVVVAIIALLVAILLPSLSRARAQAKSAVCKANLHELGNQFQMYAHTYKEYFPLSKEPGSDNFYYLYLARIMKNPNILLCPGTKNLIRPESLVKGVTYDDGPGHIQVGKLGDLSNAAKGAGDNSGGHSYEYQGVYEGNPDIWPLARKFRRSSHFPGLLTQMSLVFDNDPGDSTLGAQGCSPSRGSITNLNGNNCPQPWDNHGTDGTNMMFADGHADFVKKMAGQYNDMSANSPKDHGKPSWQNSTTALTDQFLVKTQYPWQYTLH